VLALPRGGVPVAFEVALSLGAPLDVFVVRKLGLPGHPELAMGAIASGSLRVVNDEVIRMHDVSQEAIARVTAEEMIELERRERTYRLERAIIDVEGRTVILIDDGLATGSTMRAAVAALRRRGPAKIVAAVPVAAPQTCAELRAEVDEMICAITPESFYAVGDWYERFDQTTDQEVRKFLDEAARRFAERSATTPDSLQSTPASK
jgi:putative phosphoribosyl transferase